MQVILTYRHRSGPGDKWKGVRDPVPLTWMIMPPWGSVDVGQVTVSDQDSKPVTSL